jgi:hypothetical protein
VFNSPRPAVPARSAHPQLGPDRVTPDYRPLTSAVIPTLFLPIPSDAVAARKGTLHTCTIPGLHRKRKSSTSAPWRSTACARTRTPPAARSSSRTSGTSFCSAFMSPPFAQRPVIFLFPFCQHLFTICQEVVKTVCAFVDL